nr:PRTRC system protein C [Stenotrophomonas pavanii]
MTATTATALERRFRFGVTTLADPDPSLTPLEALRLHARSYAFLATANLGEPVVEGDFLVYPVLKPAVQTKGAGKKPAAKDQPSLEDILTWGKATATPDGGQPKRWEGVHAVAKQRLTAKTNPLIESFLIPMA